MDDSSTVLERRILLSFYIVQHMTVCWRSKEFPDNDLLLFESKSIIVSFISTIAPLSTRVEVSKYFKTEV